MAHKNSIPIRTDPLFAEEISDIKRRRIDNHKDPQLKPTRTARITLAMKRHPLFGKIKNDIIEADLP